MDNLYEYNLEYGRMGDLEGRFLATKEEVDSLIGETIHFGEVLGKHSDVYDDDAYSNISLVTDNQEFLSKAKELGIDLESGINPLDYID